MALSNPWIHGPETGEDFTQLPPHLQGVETKIVYIGVVHPIHKKRFTWNLLGSHKGREGIVMAPVATGLFHTPFETLMSEGPYQIGAEPERTDWKKRMISIGVHVNPDIAPWISGSSSRVIDTPFRYRMIEERWWGSWSATEDGYLGVFTRTHGWRWLRVRLAEEPKDPWELDPVAFGNNFMTWSMNIVATQPYFAKPTQFKTWQNDIETSTLWDLIEDLLNEYIPGLDVGEGMLRVPNRGDIAVYPKFLVSSPGKCWIQEGDRWVELPLLSPQDGYVMVDTDPNAQTLTATTDPVDPLFMRILRNSQLLDVLLHDLLSITLPVWRRMEDRFTEASKIPPRTPAAVKVRHSNADGRVTMFVPQRYSKGFA